MYLQFFFVTARGHLPNDERLPLMIRSQLGIFLAPQKPLTGLLGRFGSGFLSPHVVGGFPTRDCSICWRAAS